MCKSVPCYGFNLVKHCSYFSALLIFAVHNHKQLVVVVLHSLFLSSSVCQSGFRNSIFGANFHCMLEIVERIMPTRRLKLALPIPA